MLPLTNGGTNYIATPQWMYNLVGQNKRLGPSGVHVTRPTARPGGDDNNNNQAHRWEGRGNRLGST